MSLFPPNSLEVNAHWIRNIKTILKKLSTIQFVYPCEQCRYCYEVYCVAFRNLRNFKVTESANVETSPLCRRSIS